MKKNHIFILLITSAILLIITGCDLKDENPTNPDLEKTVYDVSIVGEVVEAITGNPIAQATIIITDNVTVKGTTTNEEGKYSTTFQVDKDQELKVIAKKDGFLNDTSSVFVMKDFSNSVPLVRSIFWVNSSLPFSKYSLRSFFTIEDATPFRRISPGFLKSISLRAPPVKIR